MFSLIKDGIKALNSLSHSINSLAQLTRVSESTTKDIRELLLEKPSFAYDAPFETIEGYDMEKEERELQLEKKFTTGKLHLEIVQQHVNENNNSSVIGLVIYNENDHNTFNLLLHEALMNENEKPLELRATPTQLATYLRMLANELEGSYDINY